jgi:hypothetical protein
MLRPGVFAAIGLAGCSLTSLEGLEDGAGGAGGAGATSASSTATSTQAATSGGDPSSSASAASGSGGAPSPSSSSAEASVSAASSTSTGGGCPDACDGETSTICDGFDGSDGFGAWGIETDGESESDFSLVQAPHLSCPNAVAIDFFGPGGGDVGGWAELYRSLDGVPTEVVFRASLYRETSVLGMEGVLEVYWERGDEDCHVQVQISEEAHAVQFFANQFSEDGSGLSLGGDYFSLGDAPTVGTWLELELTVGFAPPASAKLTVNGLGPTFEIDPDGIGVCDEPPDPGTFNVLIGAPYNEAPTRLVYDDVRVDAR